MYTDVCQRLKVHFSTPLHAVHAPALDFTSIIWETTREVFEKNVIAPSEELTFAIVNRMLGTAKFVGCLVSKNLIPITGVLGWINLLVTRAQTNAQVGDAVQVAICERYLELVCALLTSVGASLNTSTEWSCGIDPVWLILDKMCRTQRARLQCVIRDTLDLKDAMWEETRAHQIEKLPSRLYPPFDHQLIMVETTRDKNARLQVILDRCVAHQHNILLVADSVAFPRLLTLFTRHYPAVEVRTASHAMDCSACQGEVFLLSTHLAMNENIAMMARITDIVVHFDIGSCMHSFHARLMGLCPRVMSYSFFVFAYDRFRAYQLMHLLGRSRLTVPDALRRIADDYRYKVEENKILPSESSVWELETSSNSDEATKCSSVTTVWQ